MITTEKTLQKNEKDLHSDKRERSPCCRDGAIEIVTREIAERDRGNVEL